MKNATQNLVKLISAILLMGNLGCSAQKKAATASLFDGSTLKGLTTVKKENEKFWTVNDSIITGGDGIIKIPTNSYLHTVERYGDFEFRCLFRITGDHNLGLINSGIQYRSFIKDGKITGYQADIGRGYWGDIYDEHRRGKLLSGDLSTLKYILNEEGWNSYIIRCKGNMHETYINGAKTAEYHEKDADVPSEGIIGIQVHSGGNAKIEIRNVTITEL